MITDKSEVRVLIIGNTECGNIGKNEEFIDFCIAPFKDSKIIIMSKFPDETATHYAIKNGYELEQFTQNWIEHGSKSANVRDKMMIELADCIIIFNNGSCAGSSALTSEKLNKPFWVSYTGCSGKCPRFDA